MIKSAGRVLDVLEVLAASPVPLGVNEIARRLTIPRSSSSLLLRTLGGRGYVSRDGDGYRLNAEFVQGWVAGLDTHLVTVARPIMASVVDRTGESVFLGVLTPDWTVRYLDKLVSPQDIRYDADIASRRPAHCTSIGLVLLAYRPPRDVKRWLRSAPLERHTSRTLTSRSGVLAVLEKVRRAGYAVNVDGRVVGVSGVSAPIRGHDGEVVAALNVAAPTARFAQVESRMTDAVLDGARDISRLLGGSDGERRPPRTRRLR